MGKNESKKKKGLVDTVTELIGDQDKLDSTASNQLDRLGNTLNRVESAVTDEKSGVIGKITTKILGTLSGGRFARWAGKFITNRVSKRLEKMGFTRVAKWVGKIGSSNKLMATAFLGFVGSAGFRYAKDKLKSLFGIGGTKSPVIPPQPKVNPSSGVKDNFNDTTNLERAEEAKLNKQADSLKSAGSSLSSKLNTSISGAKTIIDAKVDAKSPEKVFEHTKKVDVANNKIDQAEGELLKNINEKIDANTQLIRQQEVSNKERHKSIMSRLGDGFSKVMQGLPTAMTGTPDGTSFWRYLMDSLGTTVKSVVAVGAGAAALFHGFGDTIGKYFGKFKDAINGGMSSIKSLFFSDKDEKSQLEDNQKLGDGIRKEKEDDSGFDWSSIAGSLGVGGAIGGLAYGGKKLTELVSDKYLQTDKSSTEVSAPEVPDASDGSRSGSKKKGGWFKRALKKVTGAAKMLRSPKALMKGAVNIVKILLKSGLSLAGKAFPLTGLAYGLWDAYQRYQNDEPWYKVAAAAASAITSLLPGIGTAATVTIQGALMASDFFGSDSKSEAEDQKAGMEVSKDADGNERVKFRNEDAYRSDAVPEQFKNAADAPISAKHSAPEIPPITTMSSPRLQMQESGNGVTTTYEPPADNSQQYTELLNRVDAVGRQVKVTNDIARVSVAFNAVDSAKTYKLNGQNGANDM